MAKAPILKVVFDTNVLYTQVASDLVRSSLATLVHENSEHNDLKIEWHLPGKRSFYGVLPSLNIAR